MGQGGEGHVGKFFFHTIFSGGGKLSFQMSLWLSQIVKALAEFSTFLSTNLAEAYPQDFHRKPINKGRS